MQGASMGSKPRSTSDMLGKTTGFLGRTTGILGSTTVFLGSNLGDASSHSLCNLPVLLAGGGFKHGQHLTFDPLKPLPLCNLT